MLWVKDLKLKAQEPAAVRQTKLELLKKFTCRAQR
jgi:hypothetical protein